MSRELAKRIGIPVGALLCLALAVVFALLALDVARSSDAIRAGDVRYRSSPEDDALWRTDELAPFVSARKVLGAEDDLAFRRAVRALRVSRLGDPTASISDPEIAIRRNEAQARLEAIVTGGGDRARRSRAAGLLGVLGLARFVTETQGRGALLSSTIANLQLAIALDPANDEAKHNLELAFQRGRGLDLTEAAAGANPAPGGSGAKGAGAGQAGSGY
jgi:hypothetical protein